MMMYICLFLGGFCWANVIYYCGRKSGIEEGKYLMAKDMNEVLDNIKGNNRLN